MASETPEVPISDLERDLSAVMNKHSLDDGANTPDFVLARYLIRCIDNFRELTQERENWYGVHLAPAGGTTYDNVRTENGVGSETPETGNN